MNGESLTLLLDIQRYRTIEKASTRLALFVSIYHSTFRFVYPGVVVLNVVSCENRSAIAQEMYSMFIAARSSCEVNLSSTMKEKISLALRTGKLQ
jgi:hypothetical protein